MAATLLQINFSLNVPAAEYDKLATSFGDAFANVNGLEWKIWMVNAGTREGGGIYLFRDSAAVDAFLAGPLAAEVKKAPFLDNLSIKRFDVMEALSTITRGPIAIGAAPAATV
jgi:hypothetical protein